MGSREGTAAGISRAVSLLSKTTLLLLLLATMEAGASIPGNTQATLEGTLATLEADATDRGDRRGWKTERSGREKVGKSLIRFS
jgi:hypothetical protein